MNIRWLKFHFQLTINVETTLGHWRWIDVILSMLFKRCFVNVETTSINIRRLNFHFRPNFNVEATLVHRRWIDVILSTLFCQRWNNVDKCTSAQLSFSTKYQRWNNVDERWRWWFNVDVFAEVNWYEVILRSSSIFVKRKRRKSLTYADT